MEWFWHVEPIQRLPRNRRIQYVSRHTPFHPKPTLVSHVVSTPPSVRCRCLEGYERTVLLLFRSKACISTFQRHVDDTFDSSRSTRKLFSFPALPLRLLATTSKLLHAFGNIGNLRGASERIVSLPIEASSGRSFVEGSTNKERYHGVSSVHRHRHRYARTSAVRSLCRCWCRCTCRSSDA